MKNVLQNLLIVLALALCGLCAWQWYVQTVQRTAIQDLNKMVYDRNAAIQGYTNSIASLNHKVDETDARITEIKVVAATNEQLMVAQKAQIAQLAIDHQNNTNEIAQYKVAVDTLESKLNDAYAGINKQNETISNLLSDREELATKYNDLATNRNGIVLKYNALVKQIEGQPNGGK